MKYLLILLSLTVSGCATMANSQLQGQCERACQSIGRDCVGYGEGEKTGHLIFACSSEARPVFYKK